MEKVQFDDTILIDPYDKQPLKLYRAALFAGMKITEQDIEGETLVSYDTQLLDYKAACDLAQGLYGGHTLSQYLHDIQGLPSGMLCILPIYGKNLGLIKPGFRTGMYNHDGKYDSGFEPPYISLYQTLVYKAIESLLTDASSSIVQVTFKPIHIQATWETKVDLEASIGMLVTLNIKLTMQSGDVFWLYVTPSSTTIESCHSSGYASLITLNQPGAHVLSVSMFDADYFRSEVLGILHIFTSLTPFIKGHH